MNKREKKKSSDMPQERSQSHSKRLKMIGMFANHNGTETNIERYKIEIIISSSNRVEWKWEMPAFYYIPVYLYVLFSFPLAVSRFLSHMECI